MGCTGKYAADKKLRVHVSGHKGLTVQKILKIGILSQNFLQNERFPLKCFDLNCNPRKDITIYIAYHHSYSSKNFISKEIVCLLLNSKR